MKYADKYTQASMENAMRTGDMSLLVPLKENKNNLMYKLSMQELEMSMVNKRLITIDFCKRRST